MVLVATAIQALLEVKRAGLLRAVGDDGFNFFSGQSVLLRLGSLAVCERIVFLKVGRCGRRRHDAVSRRQIP